MFKVRLIGSLALALVFGLIISSGYAFAATHNSQNAADVTTSFMLTNSLYFSDESGNGDVNGATTSLDSTTY